jgi:hypothetical protein
MIDFPHRIIRQKWRAVISTPYTQFYYYYYYYYYLLQISHIYLTVITVSKVT